MFNRFLPQSILWLKPLSVLIEADGWCYDASLYHVSRYNYCIANISRVHKINYCYRMSLKTRYSYLIITIVRVQYLHARAVRKDSIEVSGKN